MLTSCSPDTALDLDPRTVSPETFPLPTLGPVLRQACKDIYEGHGFFILRGFNEIDSLTPEDLTAVYLGISGYIAGRRGKQDQKGSMLSRFIGISLSAPAGRGGAAWLTL